MVRMAKRGYNVNGAAVHNDRGHLDQPNVSSLTCSYCQLLLREPQQVFSCGHRYCKVCIEQLTSASEGPYICSTDEKKFSKCHIRDDKACQKEIQDLSVDCPYFSNGCTWNGSLLDMEKHEEECPDGILLCSQGCGQNISRRYVDAHTSIHCPKRPSLCQFCRMEIPWDIMEVHYQSCQDHPVNCDFCETALPKRKELSAHFRECTEYSMNCPYEDCQFKGNWNAVNQHLFSSHHIQMVEDTFELREELRTVKSENQKLRSEISHLTSCEQRNEKEIERLKSIVQQLQKEMTKTPQHQFTRRQEDYSESFGPSIQRPSSSQTSTRSRAASPISKDAYKQPKREKRICQTQLQKLSENIQAIQNSLTQYAIAIEEVRLRQDVFDVMTTGTFTWKIPDVHRRHLDAVDGKTVSLYSPPFYTSPNGYRMCIRIYLNGDGIGKGTHISVYFFIMRSEHDNLLSWPFMHSVRFTLVNQKNPAASITEVFIPNPNSPSFKKPDYDINIPSGFPRFAQQGVLQDEEYTTKNTLIIHCHIDPNGLALL